MKPLRPKLPRMAALPALRLSLCVISATILAACSGESPAAPTPPPAPMVTSVTVAGTNSVNVGSTTAMTATARRSDGSAEVVSSTATWQSSNPAVATVSSTGGVRAVSPGTSMISAAFGGQTGQLSVQVMAVAPAPNIQLVTVALDRVVINGTCDADSLFEDSGDGEFSFRFEVERSGGGRTSLWVTNGQAFKIGPYSLANYSLTFARNVSQGEDFILWFTATESDGVLGADPKLSGASVGRPHIYQNGTWAGGGNSITLGTSDCGATIRWDVSSVAQR